MGTGADQHQVDCSVPGATHAGGIPGPNCPANGCKLVDAVVNGTMPLAVFNQSLARILYQEQRFGILGCDQTPVSSLCTNPGGVGSDRTGTAPLPLGATLGDAGARHQVRRRGDRRAVLRGGRDAAQERAAPRCRSTRPR